MPLYFKKEAANLKTLLKQRPEDSRFTENTIGDLHANVITFIFTLKEIGLLPNFSQYFYNILFDTYYRGFAGLDINELNDKLKLFEFIIDQMHFDLSKKMKLRLIGDELCDRGTCDWFILLLIEKLSKEGVDFEILISNHSMEFLSCFEKNKRFDDNDLLFGQGQSAAALQQLIDKGIISRDRVESIVKDHYLPHLKLFSYTESDDRVAIYTHAPNRIETLNDLICKIMGESPSNGKTLSLELIDKCNQHFQDEYVKKGRIHHLRDEETPSDPFELLIWSRQPVKSTGNELVIVTANGNKSCCFVHGHDSTDKQMNAEHVNLDNKFGKEGLPDSQGDYIILGHSPFPLPNLDGGIYMLLPECSSQQPPPAPVDWEQMSCNLSDYLAKDIENTSDGNSESSCSVWSTDANFESSRSVWSTDANFESTTNAEPRRPVMPIEPLVEPDRIILSYFIEQLIPIASIADDENYILQVIKTGKTLKQLIENLWFFNESQKEKLGEIYSSYRNSPSFCASDWDKILEDNFDSKRVKSWLLAQLKSHFSQKSDELSTAILSNLENLENDEMLIRVNDEGSFWGEDQLWALKQVKIRAGSSEQEDLIEHFQRSLATNSSVASSSVASSSAASSSAASLPLSSSLPSYALPPIAPSTHSFFVSENVPSPSAQERKVDSEKPTEPDTSEKTDSEQSTGPNLEENTVNALKKVLDKEAYPIIFSKLENVVEESTLVDMILKNSFNLSQLKVLQRAMHDNDISVDVLSSAIEQKINLMLTLEEENEPLFDEDDGLFEDQDDGFSDNENDEFSDDEVNSQGSSMS